MHEKLLALKVKLNELHDTLSALNFPQENFIELGNYTFPFLHKVDLVELPLSLVIKIELMDKYDPTENDIRIIDNAIITLENSKPNIEYLAHTGANVSGPAISAYFISMLYISHEINNIFSFEVLKDRNLLPKSITRRLDLYNANLESIANKTGDLELKVNTINEAYDSAEGLPTTLKALRDTNSEITSLKSSSSTNNESINNLLDNSLNAHDKIIKHQEDVIKLSNDVKKEAESYLSSLRDAAQSYIDKCEEAFRTTTSKGLAGAFEDKAKKLNKSIQFWVAGLIFALAAGAWVGYYRLHALEVYLSAPESSGAKLLLQLILSIFSVGAPLWFAWLATKQIGQRFRLAEDYEFKASVSKAYEGYRREALQLDEDFSQRLFGNALTRLEEPPLRFVEETAHSSPLMEILSSDKFKELIATGGDKIDNALTKAGLQRRKNTTESQNTDEINQENIPVEKDKIE